MLGLLSTTGTAWLGLAVRHTDALLVEQAHLEKKAASSAVGFLFRYPAHEGMLAPLSELAREELEHFEAVVALLRRRAIPPARMQPGPYMGRLVAAVRAREPAQLLDRLLCNAVIEARSCERMHALGTALAERDPELAAFYRSLVGSEARHNRTYLDLARDLFAADEVEARLRELLEHEAEVLATCPAEPRLHGGEPSRTSGA